MSVERFTYKQLLTPPAVSIDHFSLRCIPLELRTPAYDLRLLNGGVNKSRPFSAQEHLETDRWQNGQKVWERILSGEIETRIALSEAALRNFGGGNGEADRQTQQEAVLHVAAYALAGCDVRVLPFSADIRGVAADDFLVAGFEDGETRVAAWGILGGAIYSDSQVVSRNAARFEEMWHDALPKDASLTYLNQIASELVSGS